MSGSVRFNLAQGRVAMGTGDSCVLVPTQALLALFRDLPTEALVDFGRNLGHHAGEAVRSRVRNIQQQSAAEAVDALGSELAVLGLGSLSLEFWGQAMVFAISGSPVLLAAPGVGRVDPGDGFLGAVLEGALGRLGFAACVVAIARDGETARLLACSAGTRAQVLAWLGEGLNYGEILARLNATAGAA